jgi:hypothetical protein
MIIEIELLILIVLLFFFLDSWKNFLEHGEREAKGGLLKVIKNLTDESKVMTWEQPKDQTEEASNELLKRITK